MKIDCAYDEIIDLHKIIPNPRNANKHPEKQIEMLAKIIDYQGQRAPIVVSKRSGFITKGHGRLAAIQKLGWEKAAVDFQDYESEAQEHADMIADNKIAELADPDALMINELALEMPSDFDFELLGIEDFSPNIPSFEPGDLDEQGKLDQLKPMFCKCPECNHAFDAREHEIKD